MNQELINDPSLVGFQIAGRRRIAPDEAERREALRAAVDLREGDFRYAIMSDGAARLVSYEGSGAVVRIPAQAGGRAVREIDPHLFADHDEIERVEVAEGSRFETDGVALYADGGTVVSRLVVPLESYDVAQGCRVVGDHAFDSHAALLSVRLPEGVERIGRLAFAKSGVREVAMPRSLREVGEKAFYLCRDLAGVRLPERLEAIGAEAFCLSGLARILIPSTVASIGERAFAKTPAQRSIAQGAIAFPDAGARFDLDAEGGMYRGDELVEYIGPASSCRVRVGTRHIASAAFRRNPALRAVELPEGVASIGDETFRGCSLLGRVDLPESLEEIGDRAFLDTSLTELRIGPNVRRIGEAALLVQGDQLMRPGRPLERVDVDEANEAFYLEGGLLCERGGDEGGGDDPPRHAPCARQREKRRIAARHQQSDAVSQDQRVRAGIAAWAWRGSARRLRRRRRGTAARVRRGFEAIAPRSRTLGTAFARVVAAAGRLIAWCGRHRCCWRGRRGRSRCLCWRGWIGWRRWRWGRLVGGRRLARSCT